MSITEKRGTPFTIEEIRERVTPVLAQYNVEMAVLFGSYAKGSATSKSDVDMIVKCNQTGMDFYSLYFEVEDSLEGVKLDFFDVRELKNGITLESEMFKCGVNIYAKQ